MRRFLILGFSIIASMYLSPDTALAWGKFGHLTVCELAYRKLTDPAKAELNRLFRKGKGGIVVEGRNTLPDRTYTSFNRGCLEEDELPRKNDIDHYVNVDRKTKTIDANTCPLADTCVFAAITRDFDNLRNRSLPDSDRVFALMALGHWIGDIHQPLHVSFADDRGGGWIKIDLEGKCGTSRESKPDNLHAVWDKCLLDAGMFERVRKRDDFKKTWSRFTITYRAADTLLWNTSWAEEKTLVGQDYAKWAQESYVYTIHPDTLYCTMIGDACAYSTTTLTLPKKDQARTQAISQQYLADHEAIAQERVRKAGLRLAHLMNLALDPDYTTPIKSEVQKP